MGNLTLLLIFFVAVASVHARLLPWNVLFNRNAELDVDEVRDGYDGSDDGVHDGYDDGVQAIRLARPIGYLTDSQATILDEQDVAAIANAKSPREAAMEARTICQDRCRELNPSSHRQLARCLQMCGREVRGIVDTIKKGVCWLINCN